MNRFYSFAPILLLACLPGCFSFGNNEYLTSGSTELARIEQKNGPTKVYQLKANRKDGSINLVVRAESKLERADLGMTIAEIDKQAARQKDLTPYQGLLVKAIKAGGAADNCGIIPGDILVAINGVDLLYKETLLHILKNNNPPQKEVALTILRGFKNRQELALKLTPDSQPVTIPTTKSYDLGAPKYGERSYAGITVGTLPPELTADIYGEKVPAVLVGSVVVGSPAYFAGLRCGDRVLTLNGTPIRSAQQLVEIIQNQGKTNETVQVKITTWSGDDFSTDLALSDFHGDTDIHIPFVFRLDNNPRETEWHFGPLHCVASYDGTYKERKTREANFVRRFSCLVGLFKRTWSPNWSRTTLFWLFDFHSN